MKLKPDQVKRVVVRGTNWVGDAVITVPALRELRTLLPDAHITLATRPGPADVFDEAELADEVLIVESAWKQIGEWREQKFDLALLFQNAFQAAAIAFLARVPVRVGYATERRSFLLTHPVPTPRWKEERHEVFYYLNLVTELERVLYGTSSIETNEPRFGLGVADVRRKQASALLHKYGARLGAPVVVICPGSINSRAKRWPAERYAAVADQFIETGASVALIGSAAESDVSGEVSSRMKGQAFDLTGKTTVAEVTAIISVASVLITNDTGPAHIGAAVGTPTLVIFGPTNPLTTRPFAPTSDIIRHPPECAPCMLRDCPIDHRCMTAITPAEVFERARVLMAAHVEVTV